MTTQNQTIARPDGIGELAMRSRSQSIYGEAFRRLFREKPMGSVGGALVALFIVVAVTAPLIARYNPIEHHEKDRIQAPSVTYWLGTDNFGRDIYSRIVHGATISMYVGLGTVMISTVLATIVGIISGYFGGILDTLIQRVVDAFMAFPWLVIVLSIAAVLGTGNIMNLVIAMGFIMAIANSRIVRSSALSVKEHTFIEAARCVGCRDRRIIWSHVLPNVLAPIIVIVTLNFGAAILIEATISFLGYGIQPPTPSWGQMLSGFQGRAYLLQAPWMAFFPGLAISMVVFGLNMLGDALRDVLDPRLRK